MSFSRDFPSFQDYSTIDSICPSPKISPNFKIIQPLIQYGLLPRFPQISQDFKKHSTPHSIYPSLSFSNFCTFYWISLFSYSSMSPAFSGYFACLLRDKGKYLPPVSNIHWISSLLYPDLRWIGGHRTVAIQPDLTISDNEANLPKAATSNKTHNHPKSSLDLFTNTEVEPLVKFCHWSKL